MKRNLDILYKDNRKQTNRIKNQKCFVAQSYQTLCDFMDCSPPGSPSPWGFSRQEYWSRLSYPPPGDLPEAGIKLTFLKSHALAGGSFTINTRATILYIAYFSYSLYLYSLQCDFAAFHIKSSSPYSLLLNLDWPCNSFGAGKCNRSDGVSVQSKVSSAVLASLCSFSWNPEYPL